MQTKSYTIYNFDELSDKAKEKARSWYREASSGDSYWSECTIEEAKEQGENMGLDIDNVYWSGFSSQGSGACFEGSWHASSVKVGETAKDWGDSPATKEIKRIASCFEEIAEKYPSASFIVKHRGHYQHENCTDFTIESGEYYEEIPEGGAGRPDYEKFYPEYEESLIEAAKDFMRWIYRQLEKEYEYQNADEQVDESILANDYTFDECGNRED